MFELASCLTSVAIWKMSHAAVMCREAGTMGVDSSTAAQVGPKLMSCTDPRPQMYSNWCLHLTDYLHCGQCHTDTSNMT